MNHHVKNVTPEPTDLSPPTPGTPRPLALHGTFPLALRSTQDFVLEVSMDRSRIGGPKRYRFHPCSYELQLRRM